ncbi:L-type lectin-domain containing receptor kinase IV.2 [Hibiscus syriacus]|uniref:non-specific serine/threonine protein kinase n=1 Tax=Hibiscus syriacus TaxID=106335 RepID=A0A6A2ZXK7_HIBSY|nr:L-type lectin-domain containing receptor kinase IV.2 [Hibiscus syriacus]
MAMCLTFMLAIPLTLLVSLAASDDVGFIYNGFRSANLSLDGIAQFTSNGLLKLTNESRSQTAHAFYPHLVSFKNSTNGSVSSFSTTFVFAIASGYQSLSGHGLAFVISPTKSFPGAFVAQYLGLFNDSNNGNQRNHVVAVEFDTIPNTEFKDINGDHVGIDINGLNSRASFPAGYYEDGSRQFRKLSLALIGGQRIQVWVEYHGLQKRMDVTLARFRVSKPKTPLLSFFHDLSLVVKNEMYVGFSSSTGVIFESIYVLGWSFKMNGKAQELTLSQLPKLPHVGPKKTSMLLTTGLPSILVCVILVAVSGVVFSIRRKRKFAELVEDWVLEYGPHRFKFKDLYIAAKGFKDKELLGAGGFGRVYRGVLPSSKLEVAVKRVSHESRQGMKEFIAEIEQVVIHRDVKASNVLLDGELNGRLGDFGLARLYDHETEPHTTHVVGTLGYLAPELTRTGKATPCTDVFAFGAFLLEVACGRRPISQSPTEAVILVDWVYSCWSKGDILEAKDRNMGSNYVAEEVELVLKLGLICSHSEPNSRPTMLHVVQIVEGDMPLQEMSLFRPSSRGLTFSQHEGFDDFCTWDTSSSHGGFSHSSSVAASLGFLNPSTAAAASKNSQQPPLPTLSKPDGPTSCCRRLAATPPPQGTLQNARWQPTTIPTVSHQPSFGESPRFPSQDRSKQNSVVAIKATESCQKKERPQQAKTESKRPKIEAKHQQTTKQTTKQKEKSERNLPRKTTPQSESPLASKRHQKPLKTEVVVGARQQWLTGTVFSYFREKPERTLSLLFLREKRNERNERNERASPSGQPFGAFILLPKRRRFGRGIFCNFAHGQTLSAAIRVL